MTPLSFLFGGGPQQEQCTESGMYRRANSRGCGTPGSMTAPRFGKSRSESLVALWPFPMQVTNVSGSREWMYLYPSRPCITVHAPNKRLSDIHPAGPVLLNYVQAKVALPAFVSVGMAKLLMWLGWKALPTSVQTTNHLMTFHVWWSLRDKLTWE